MSAPNTRRGPQGGPAPARARPRLRALLIASVAVWIGAPQAGGLGGQHAELCPGAHRPDACRGRAGVRRRLAAGHLGGHGLPAAAHPGRDRAGAVIGLAGGILAAASLAVSGLVTWVAADTAHIVSPALAKVLSDLSFAAGAAGFVCHFAAADRRGGRALADPAAHSEVASLVRPGGCGDRHGIHADPAHLGARLHPAHRPVRRPDLHRRRQRLAAASRHRLTAAAQPVAA